MSISIILVDDHELVRQGLRALLEKRPEFEVLDEAGDGQRAIELVKELNPDVVVIDVEMPGFNGIEAARRISELGVKTKILALSMHTERQYVSEIMAAGASGYILKKSAIEELETAIKRIYAGKMYCSPSLISLVMEDYADRLSREKDSELAKLTPREIEVLRLITGGLNTKEVAYELKLSIKTIETYRLQIMRKLKINNIVELVKYAIREGLAEL